jgi:mannonate dehydratase
MRLGLDCRASISDELLRFGRQLGTTDAISGGAALARARSASGPAHLEYGELARAREQVEAAGMHLHAIENLPFPWYGDLFYGGTQRDLQIENWQETLRNMGRAGIPILGYCLMEGSAGRYSTRTDLMAAARGGAQVSHYDHDRLNNPTAAAHATWPDVKERAGMSEAQMLENVEGFLQAVLPVAAEVGVKLALHPDDPPVPSIHGLPRLASSHAGLRRLLELVPSDHHGLDFCQGTISEMDEDVYKAIRYFGRQGKIFYVHFRNVSGPVPAFVESFIDDGYVDMARAIRLYREAGVDVPLIEDHVPHLSDDDDHQHRSRAFAMGYIKALLDSVGEG